ncbi:hypothetical protein FZC78_21300 [Rossellomorea vietnamensis]|uniref:Uncharacterized protein n=1 Tax=Rossellomorea vietnamensis TaxID=218284 RepID=A0A5D4NGT2_9BACI|nr:hypothetical protein [Rossellomorea vietnamensis]TYS13503.1 hypothetical protein FZC78_21300 [Rossellomorea vietnamensis]
MKKIFIHIFIFQLSLILFACSYSSAEKVRELQDEELLVKHWQELPDERKYTLIQEVQSEGAYRVKESREVQEHLIMLFDAGMRNTPYHDNNLMKAIEEFNEDREITENSK